MAKHPAGAAAAGEPDAPVTPEAEMAAPQPEAPGDAPAKTPEIVTIKVDPLSAVTVKNHGTSPWHGSDFKFVSSGFIPAGGTGLVTLKKAQQLIADYGPEGKDGRGPFEIVG